MNDIRLLMGLELRGLFGWNRFRHTRDPKERRRWLLLAGVWGVLGVMIAVYMGGLAYGLIQLQLAALLPAYLTFLCSALIFLFGLFRTGSLLFSPKGYDQLRALPVRPKAIVVSRLAMLYAEDAALTLALLTPAVVVCGVLTAPGPWFWLTMGLGVLLIPLLPLTAAAALGVLVAALAARMRRKTLARTALSLVLCLGILALSVSLGGLETVTPEQLADLAGLVNGLFARLYPPALWMGSAAAGEPVRLVPFAALSLFAALLLTAVTSRRFDSILRRLQATSARKDYRLGRLQAGALLPALYRRELRRYFASTVYVTNTIPGPILAVAMAAALCITGVDSLPPLPVDIRPLLSLLLAAVLNMMPPTAMSVSMEGKQIWQIQCLPVPAGLWLKSKLLVSLTFALPAWLISQVLLTLALKPTLPELLWQWLLPLVLVAFCNLFALWVDGKLHRFDWQREEQPVKQGASAMIGGLCGSLICLLCGLPLLLLPDGIHLLRAVLCLLLIALSLLLDRRLRTVDLSKL